MKLTRDDIEALRSDAGGFTDPTVRALGFTFRTFTSGWIKRLVGSHISDTLYRSIHANRNLTAKRAKMIASGILRPASRENTIPTTLTTPQISAHQPFRLLCDSKPHRKHARRNAHHPVYAPSTGGGLHYRLNFGKHKGQTLGEVPMSYVRWLAGEEFPRHNKTLWDAINEAIEKREPIEDFREPSKPTPQPSPTRYGPIPGSSMERELAEAPPGLF